MSAPGFLRSTPAVCAFAAALLASASTAAAQEIIVYETYGYYGGPADIHVVNPDGTGDVNLTPDTENSMELDPELSPDGTRIVFISNRVAEQNPDGNFEIFSMAVDGSDVRQVTVTEDPFGQGGLQSYNPTWSPDGLQIAFDGYRGLYSSSEIYVINADGSGERPVTSSADFANKWLPDWSPDGSLILFTWGWDYWYQDVRTITPDGTVETNLTPDTIETAQGSAVWSPDGRRIAFSGDGTIPGNYPNPNREIFVMEYPSLAITQVTEHAAVDESPSWSADGTEITFASPREVFYALYVVAAPPVPAAAETLEPAASLAPAPLTTSDGFRLMTAAYAPAEATLASPSVESTAVVTAEPPIRKIDTTAGNEADPFWGRVGTAPVRHTLTVTKLGRGTGFVRTFPSGIACGVDCSESYVAGTTVTLVARAATNSVFAGWAGACTGTSPLCTITLDAARSVTAVFVRRRQ